VPKVIRFHPVFPALESRLSQVPRVFSQRLIRLRRRSA